MSATANDTPALELQDVCFSYGAMEVLRKVSLCVKPGCTLGFVGPNGAGKTTTFGIIAGFLRPEAGEVRVLGGSAWDIGHIKGKLSILPQDAQLIANVGIERQMVFFAELLGFEDEAAEKEAERVLELVGLAEHVKKHPGHLSHGMAKRAGLAQAFIGDPQVVLLDEPTAGLDPFGAKQIRDLIASMGGERTVVVSSHNLAEVQDICDEVALIHKGQLLKHEPIDAITERQNQIHIQIKGGHPPVEFFKEVEQLQGVLGVVYVPEPGAFTINLTEDAPPAEEIIKEVVPKIFAIGLSIGEIQRGTTLENAFLDLTGEPSEPSEGEK